MAQAAMENGEADDAPRLMASGRRAPTIGTVALVSLIAYEAIANATLMPAAATALGGVAWYGLLFGGPLAASIIGLVAAARWADEHSPRRAVHVSVACFVAGLLLAAAAPSIGMLVAGRIVTGLGSGMLAVALYALVGQGFAPALHARLFAMFSAAWVLPSLLAPALSGGLAQWLGWRWPMALVAVLALPPVALLRAVPSPARPSPTAASNDHRLRWAVLAACGALALHALGQARARIAPLPTWAVFVLLACAVATLLESARRLLPPGTAAARVGLPAAIALGGLSQGAFFTAEAFVPLLLHRERGVPLAVAGLALTAGALSWSASAFWRARVHARLGPVRLLRRGHALLAGGIAVSMLAIAPTLPLGFALLGWTIAGAGMGLISPTLSILTLALAPQGQIGRTGAALRLAAAMTTAAALAVSGAAFAALVRPSPPAAFVACLGLAAAFAFCGWVLAGRVEVPAR